MRYLVDYWKNLEVYAELSMSSNFTYCIFSVFLLEEGPCNILSVVELSCGLMEGLLASIVMYAVEVDVDPRFARSEDTPEPAEKSPLS